MDLMKEPRDVPPPRPEARDRARTAPMAGPAVVRPERRSSWSGVGAALGAAAVAAAVVMGATGGTAPAGPAEAAPRVVVESPLVELASHVKAACAQPGDASLVITAKTAPDNSPYTVYTVYTDRGQVFHGDSVAGLATTVGRGDDSAQPFDAKVMAAARLAASGDVEEARIAMVNASPNGWGLGLSPAEADEAWARYQAETAEELRRIGKQVPDPGPRPTGEELETGIDNRLWHNTTYALFIGAANVDVRAGVLKLLATVPDVTIGEGEAEVDGRPALTLTAGPALHGGSGSHLITINAEDGLPIRTEVVPAEGSAEPSERSVVTYESSRVRLADVVAGRI
ncbi:hypothetical protein ACFV4N_12415 [Actinosynnema sp. NPDC059797]